MFSLVNSTPEGGSERLPFTSPLQDALFFRFAAPRTAIGIQFSGLKQRTKYLIYHYFFKCSTNSNFRRSRNRNKSKTDCGPITSQDDGFNLSNESTPSSLTYQDARMAAFDC